MIAAGGRGRPRAWKCVVVAVAVVAVVGSFETLAARTRGGYQLLSA